MANMTLIETKTAGSGGVANFEFTAIAATYTDLYLLCSLRASRSVNSEDVFIQFNSSASNFAWKNIYSTGSGTPVSQSASDNTVGACPAASMTGGAFGSLAIYISNYAAANYKSVNTDSTAENNSARGDNAIYATLWSVVDAITTVKLVPTSGTFVEYSSVSLYGILKTTSSTKATGGIVSSDGTYNYHMFPFTGTYAPTTAHTADILVVAGGGSGGGRDSNYGGGGGGGGLLTFTSESLTVQSYTCTVGAGGARITTGGQGNTGSDSQFGSLTLVKGGGGGSGITGAGSNGGSGGGGSRSYAGGSATSGQGSAGGTSGSSGSGSGGGGAGAAGSASTTSAGGTGGIGATSALINAMGIATQTGESLGSNIYFAGGGAGMGAEDVNRAGGTGGGGFGGGWSNITTGGDGTANMGGGGGGTSGNVYTSGAGGSGIIIIRYTI